MKQKIDDLELPKPVLELWRFCSPDEQRGNLGFVKIEFVKGKATAVATNGHILAKFEWSIMNADFDDSVLIPAATCKAACKHWRKNSRSTLSIENDQGVIERKDLLESNEFDEPGDINFPDWRQVWPQQLSKKFAPFGIDATYVGILAGYMKKSGSKNTYVTIRGKYPESPIIFDGGYLLDGSFEALIMPVRI